MTVGMLAEEDAAVLTPVLVDSDQLPGDGGGEGAKNGFVGGVDVERGGDAEEERVVRGKLNARKVAVAGDVSGTVQPADAKPVVEGLEGQVEVVVGFELEDGEAALAREGLAG